MGQRISLEKLENRLLLSVADIPNDEQQTLELINRMRQNPAAELPLLENSTDPNVQAAFSFFHVNLATLANQWARLTPAPPLAFNSILYGTALAHDQLMLSNNTQSHQIGSEPVLQDRISAAGYSDYSSLRESVYSYATSVFDAHAAFAVDWGNTSTGIQKGHGHRDNIMAPDVREIGIAALPGSGNGDGSNVGPILFTEDFGAHFSQTTPFLLGSVFNDANADGFYTAGEGMSGVTVKITGTGGTISTTTLSTGAYQVQTPAGTYAIKFSHGGLAHPFMISNVVVGSDNVQLDATPADVFANVANNVLTVQGTANADTITATESAGNIIVSLNNLSETISATGLTKIVLRGAAGRDSLEVDNSVLLPASIVGGNGGDTLQAGSTPATLQGSGGSDSLIGGSAADSLDGGNGNDTLIAGNGGDTLSAGIGNNHLVGGAGNDLFFAQNSSPDTITGGGGSDTLFGDKTLDSITGVGNLTLT